jgi:hypothetical protein
MRRCCAWGCFLRHSERSEEFLRILVRHFRQRWQISLPILGLDERRVCCKNLPGEIAAYC